MKWYNSRVQQVTVAWLYSYWTPLYQKDRLKSVPIYSNWRRLPMLKMGHLRWIRKSMRRHNQWYTSQQPRRTVRVKKSLWKFSAISSTFSTIFLARLISGRLTTLNDACGRNCNYCRLLDEYLAPLSGCSIIVYPCTQRLQFTSIRKVRLLCWSLVSEFSTYLFFVKIIGSYFLWHHSDIMDAYELDGWLFAGLAVTFELSSVSPAVSWAACH